jgi:hypothetical protein
MSSDYDDDYDDDYHDDYDDDYDYGYWKADEKELKRDFMNYADPKTKRIVREGYEKMGETLGINIYTDIFITYFLYKCESKQLDFITEEDYIRGMKAFKCNTLKDLKDKIMGIREKLLEIDGDNFRKFYYYLFDFNVSGGAEEKKTKSLSYDEVEVYFNGLFCEKFPVAKEFLVFLKEKKNKCGLKWDEWRTFLDFIQNQGKIFPKDYNPAEYYPVIVDDFYYWYCQKHGIKIKNPDEDEEI